MVQSILFVDDQPQVLNGLRRLLQAYRHEWEMHFCDDPAAAVRLVGERAFDVVVAEMQMPRMDGRELLERVRRVQPDAIRIMLSGDGELARGPHEIGPAHQHLAKPCDPNDLQLTIQRAGAIGRRLREPGLRRLVAGMSSLPSLPDAYRELAGETSCGDATIERVGALIALDPAMTARLLGFANSSCFDLPETVRDPAQAAALLGVDVLRALVLADGVFRHFESSTAPASLVEEVLQHSLAVGSLARRICETELGDHQTAFAALLGGLLHDVGKLILADHFGARYVRLLDEANNPAVDLGAVEMQEFGGPHTSVGGFLAGAWGMPHDVVEAVAFHHDPPCDGPSRMTPLAAVRAANGLAKNCAALGIDPFDRDPAPHEFSRPCVEQDG